MDQGRVLLKGLLEKTQRARLGKPCGRSRHQTGQEYPHNADRVLRRHGEDVLDEEGIQLHDLPHEHKLADGNNPHPRGTGVEPPRRLPRLWSELQQRPFDLSRSAPNVPNGLPVMFPHLKEATNLFLGTRQ